MAKSTIIFFDTHHNSKLGTLRGLISFPIFVVLLVLLARPINTWSKVLGVSLMSFVLCSAISVQLPSSNKDAAVYGALVGFVIGAMLTGTLLVAFPDAPALLKWSVVLLPIITSILSVLTFALSTKWGLYK